MADNDDQTEYDPDPKFGTIKYFGKNGSIITFDDSMEYPLVSTRLPFFEANIPQPNPSPLPPISGQSLPGSSWTNPLGGYPNMFERITLTGSAWDYPVGAQKDVWVFKPTLIGNWKITVSCNWELYYYTVGETFTLNIQNSIAMALCLMVVPDGKMAGLEETDISTVGGPYSDIHILGSRTYWGAQLLDAGVYTPVFGEKVLSTAVTLKLPHGSEVLPFVIFYVRTGGDGRADPTYTWKELLWESSDLKMTVTDYQILNCHPKSTTRPYDILYPIITDDTSFSYEYVDD